MSLVAGMYSITVNIDVPSKFLILLDYANNIIIQRFQSSNLETITMQVTNSMSSKNAEKVFPYATYCAGKTGLRGLFSRIMDETDKSSRDSLVNTYYGSLFSTDKVQQKYLDAFLELFEFDIEFGKLKTNSKQTLKSALSMIDNLPLP